MFRPRVLWSLQPGLGATRQACRQGLTPPPSPLPPSPFPPAAAPPAAAGGNGITGASYTLSVMSHPNKTEQKPNPEWIMCRNLATDKILAMSTVCVCVCASVARVGSDHHHPFIQQPLNTNSNPTPPAPTPCHAIHIHGRHLDPPYMLPCCLIIQPAGCRQGWRG